MLNKAGIFFGKWLFFGSLYIVSSYAFLPRLRNSDARFIDILWIIIILFPLLFIIIWGDSILWVHSLFLGMIWSMMLFLISRERPKDREAPSYVHTYDKTNTTVLIALFFVITIPLSIVYIGYEAAQAGRDAGYRVVTEESMGVILISSESLMLNPQQVSSATPITDTVHIYPGLRMLTYNDGRYFLYRSVNAECTPEQVYIVKEDDIQSIQLTSATALAPNCIPQGSAETQAIPAPMQHTTSTP